MEKTKQIKMTHEELHKYLDYVQECWNKREQPKVFEDWKKKIKNSDKQE